MGFSPFVTFQDFILFLKNRALPLFYPYGALTSDKFLKKLVSSL